MHGWMGKILHLDLSNSKIDVISTEPYAKKYLGGRGIASKIYWDTVTPGVKAYDPENRLIFMTGVLVATGTQAAARLSVVGKSPMALPEGFCYGNIGGFFGAELKRAGFDGIVVEGRAPGPVYIWINDGKAEIRDATAMWGQGAYRTGEMLQEAHGSRVRYITTGPAGENLVRTAIAFASHQSTSIAGYGAVMGSKNLKALAVLGSGKPSVFDPAGLKELTRYTVKLSKRISFGITPGIQGTGHDYILEILGKGSCYQCGMDCLRNRYRYGGREDLTDYRRCQAMEYYMPWVYGRDDEPVDTFYNAPILANDYSIDTIELRGMVDWMHRCYQAGTLSERETGLPLSKVGTSVFLEKLLHMIAYREGFGDILAEGLVRAGDKMPPKARAMFEPSLAPVGHYDEMPPRAFTAHAIIYPMEPRVHQPILHELAFTWVAWNLHNLDPKLSPVTNELFHDIARSFWGSREAGDLCRYQGKALAAQKIQNRAYIKDSLGLCDFTWPITYSFNSEDHMGDPDLEAKTFAAVTGVPAEEIDRYAERITNLQRAIMIREGRKLPQDDYPPEYNFSVPLPKLDQFNRPLLVPGPDGPVDAGGNVLDRGKFTAMLKEYYHLRGWDETTGRPGAEIMAGL